jgi:hypothetical protein
METSGRQIKNAKIVSTVLGYEDHGILTMYVTLDYGHSGQSFGGYTFDAYDPKLERRIVAGSYGMRFVTDLMRAVGVDRYEALPGTVVRVEASHDSVYRIGHFLRDTWFDPNALSKELLIDKI